MCEGKSNFKTFFFTEVSLKVGAQVILRMCRSAGITRDNEKKGWKLILKSYQARLERFCRQVLSNLSSGKIREVRLARFNVLVTLLYT